MADQDNIPPPDDPSGKPKPPPGASEVTHMAIRASLIETVRAMQESARMQGYSPHPETVCIVVAPDVAAELYRWAWLLVEHGYRAYAWDPRRMPYSAFMQAEIVGEVLGFPVLVKGLQEPGYAQFVPYHQLEAWQQAAEAVAEGKRCRSR